MDKKAVNIIKEELEKRGIKVIRIVLFGSRAKGDYKKDSDWDFLVVIDKNMDFSNKWEIIDEIKIKLAKFRIPNDVILKSKEEVDREKNDVGRITYYILEEGVEV